MANRFEQFAAPGIRRLSPYVPGKPPEQLERELGITGSIKLASNENPLGPGPHARAALAAAVAGVGMYPDGSGHILRARLAAKHQVAMGQVTLGNGSNDVLVLLAETFLTPEHEAVYSQYAFAVYPLAVQATGAKASVAAANAADHAMPLGHDPAAILAAIGPSTRIVFLANPNNPTGTWLTGRELEALVHAIPPEVIIVLDEAYHEYSIGAGVPDGMTLQSTIPEPGRRAHVFQGVWPCGTARRLRAVASGYCGPAESRPPAIQCLGGRARGCGCCAR